MKTVQVKTANKAVRIMRQEAAAKRDPTAFASPELDDTDEMKLESVLIDIISTNIADKMPKGDPEYKIFRENYDRMLEYYSERFDNIPDELHHEIFSEVDERVDEIIQILSKSLYEFCDFSNFFASCLKKLNPLTVVDETSNNKNKNNFQLLIQIIAQVGNKLLNTDPQQTETYFLEFAIDAFIEVIEQNVFKRNEMYLFYCFVSNTVNSHLRVLKRLKDKIKSKDVFYYCLSKLLIYESEAADLAPELYSFYFESAAYGLLFSSPVTRTKCVTVLSYLSKASIEPIIPLLPRLETYSNDVYWELKGQILILCANILLAFNSNDDEEKEDESKAPVLIDEEGGEVMEIHPDEDVSGLPDSIAEEPEEEKELEESKIDPVEAEEREAENIDETQNMSKIESLQKMSEEYSPTLFKIINEIFVPSAPKATLKIGLIYLAKILHFYPEFSDAYLKILLSVPDIIRTSVVDVEPIPGTEEEVLVAGATTEKYRTYGAPLEWNPLYIAEGLAKVIKEGELESFEWPHIEIFEACLQQDFYDDSLEKWLEIFTSLKDYFFISLCDRDFCRTSIEILKKVYVNENIQTEFIKASKSIFVKTLKLLYQPDVEQECKDNVKEFLEYLHECEESTPALKKMVYDVIKYFAEKNTDKFKDSNLIDLTRNVVFNKRGGEIFPGSKPASQKSSVGFAN